MSAFDDIRRQILGLDPQQAAELAVWIQQSIPATSPGIESTPGVMGGNPCVAGTRIPVWVLEALRRQGMSEARILEGYPQLRAEQLVRVWEYVAAHRAEVDRQIAEQDAA